MIIKTAKYITSATKPDQYPNLNLPEFIFFGRSNVGKSSLINAFTNYKKLAYTSSKPGKTITLNFYNINDQILLIDVPGYGYAEKMVYDRLSYGKMIEKYLASAKNLVCCFLIIDSRHKPTEDDVLMYNFLKNLDKEIVIIATKIDKISKNELQKNLNLIKTTLNCKESIIPVSAVSKKGIEIIHQLIDNKLSLTE